MYFSSLPIGYCQRKRQVFCTFLLKLLLVDWSSYRHSSRPVLLIVRIQY